jgi:integrase
VKTEALTRSQLIRFFEELDKINQRDATIARLCLHGAKRISEVIHLRTDQINYEKQQIQFKQSKSKLADDFTIISFERSAAKALFDHLKNYIEDRQGLVFTTSQGRLIQKTQVDRNFAKAGERAGIPFRVSPHNLRATAVTLWKEDGFPDSLIMKATGHASAEMVNRYDKTDIADNVTKKSCLL